MPISASRTVQPRQPAAPRAQVGAADTRLVKAMGTFVNSRLAASVDGLVRWQLASDARLPGPAAAALSKYHDMTKGHYPASSAVWKFKVDGKTLYWVCFNNPAKHDFQSQIFTTDGVQIGKGHGKTYKTQSFAPVAR